VTPVQKPSLADRLRYASDQAFARGPIVLIGWLAVLSLIIVVISALVVWLLRLAPENSLPQLLWSSFMHTMDAGTVAGDSGSWPYLFVMLAVTLGGIFVLSTLIGILTTGIQARLEALRKGRSRVIETGHTLILGWSEQIFPVISELVIANSNQPKSCIVVLAPVDKVEMEDTIRDKVGATGRTRIVCRTGSPIDMGDLQIASPQTAKAIVVLAPRTDHPDAEVIKTLLALTNAPERRQEPYHIVAELHDPANLEVARLVGKDEVEFVLIGDLIARIIAQTCRQSGLSTVYTELLDFGGDEIYFKEEPTLAGKRFGDALLAYETSTVIGLQPAGRQPILNPAIEMAIGPGDRLIFIAADDDTMRLSGHTDLALHPEAIQPEPASAPAPERTLILGWNRRAPAIINELDQYVPPGSVVTVVADDPDAEPALAEHCTNLRNQQIVYRQGDTTSRRLLDALEIPAHQHVIILCYSERFDAQQADAFTLMTLLHLRDIASQQGDTFSIVSEMLDSRNRNLAEITQADDFVVSDRLVSLMLAQVAENKALNAVFADLFDPEGAEIYLRPVPDYVQTGTPINFYTVVEAARRRREVAIGYRRAGHGTDKARLRRGRQSKQGRIGDVRAGRQDHRDRGRMKPLDPRAAGPTHALPRQLREPGERKPAR
jgi:voltage-gated potassium channel Kch